jgi:hypothetical protein
MIYLLPQDQQDNKRYCIEEDKKDLKYPKEKIKYGVKLFPGYRKEGHLGFIKQCGHGDLAEYPEN